MKQLVYISCPYDIPQTDLSAVSTILETAGYNAKHYVRGSEYNEEQTIKDCDVFVLMLNNNKFQQMRSEMSAGIGKEYYLAYKANKLVLIAYKAKDGKYYLYESALLGTVVSGIPNKGMKSACSVVNDFNSRVVRNIKDASLTYAQSNHYRTLLLI